MFLGGILVRTQKTVNSCVESSSRSSSAVYWCYLNDRRAHGTETPVVGAVIGQLEHMTPPPEMVENKGRHCCSLSILVNAGQFAELSA